MTAKRLNLRKVVDLKFGTLANKELRSLKRWLTLHENMFPLHSLGTHISRKKFHGLLGTYKSTGDYNDVSFT